MKNKINLKDVENYTTMKKEAKVPSLKSETHVEWLCRRNGLIFSFKKAGANREKVSYTYKYVLQKINHDYDLLEQIIKHYHTISKLYQYYHPEHHTLYFNLFFVKDHLKLFLDCIEALNTFNHYVDWVTLDYHLKKEGEEYEELRGHEEFICRKKRAVEPQHPFLQ